MAEGRKLQTEHAGAKNGGGFWGPRADAKRYSNRRRRQNDRAEVRAFWGDRDGCEEVPDRPAPDDHDSSPCAADYQAFGYWKTHAHAGCVAHDGILECIEVYGCYNAHEAVWTSIGCGEWDCHEWWCPVCGKYRHL